MWLGRKVIEFPTLIVGPEQYMIRLRVLVREELSVSLGGEGRGQKRRLGELGEEGGGEGERKINRGQGVGEEEGEEDEGSEEEEEEEGEEFIKQLEFLQSADISQLKDFIVQMEGHADT